MWISSDSSAEVKPRESKSEHNVGWITRTNPGGMDRPLLCSLHREPIGLMPIRHHRCDIRRHSEKSRLMLPPLKCSLKPMPLTLCPSKGRHDLGSITSPHHGTDHLLNKDGVEGLPNVHKDDGGRKLSQLSPGTEKAARHDGKFGTSAPDSFRLRHSSRQWKPRHRGCTQHAGVHLSWTAGAQNSSRVAWREWPWLARNGCHIASHPQHRSTFLRHFGTQDAERPAISLAASCNQFRRG